MPLGFYGLHLRRTDLTIGFLDHEVLELKSKYKEHHIFLCCDNEETENRLSGDNIIIRGDKVYSQKRDSGRNWTDTSYYGVHKDVLFHSNVKRSRESVLDAVIDLLILSNSKLIGNSMSSFTHVARLIQDANGGGFSKSLADPVEVSITSLLKSVKTTKFSFLALLELISRLSNPGNLEAQVILYKAWIESGMNDQVWLGHYNLYCLLNNFGRREDANAYYQELIKMKPDFLECLKGCDR